MLMVRGLVKWEKCVRRLAGSSSYPSIWMFIKSYTTRKQVSWVNSFGFVNQASSDLFLVKTFQLNLSLQQDLNYKGMFHWTVLIRNSSDEG